MPLLLLGFVLLIVVLLFGRAFTRADPKKLAKTLRTLSGWGCIGMALLLLTRGQIVLAIPLVFFGLSLLGKSLPWPAGLGGGGGGPKTGGQKSSVRTEMLEMTLDHDSGQMEGMVYRGDFAGRRLSDLSPGELELLLAEAIDRDEQAAQLLRAYMDRAGDPREGGQRQQGRGGGPGAQTMTVDEAYAVLGLKPGASRDDIHQAHRALMKKYHPDQGGTTYLAAKINEAKDLLLRLVG